MFEGKRVVVVMPAYNGSRTIERTLQEIPPGIADAIILVDDASQDNSVEVARALSLEVHCHPRNRGYGGCQKTCYRAALEAGADIVVMLHPDAQYDGSRLPDMVAPLARGQAQWSLGSRFALAGGPLKGGMPRYKYLANRALTTVENWVLGWQLSECHTGYRAYTRQFLETIPFERNSDNFVFDTQILFQARHLGFEPVEIGVETRYFPEASSISLKNSTIYGLSTLGCALRYLLHRAGWLSCPLFA